MTPADDAPPRSDDLCICGHIRNDHVVNGGCICHLDAPRDPKFASMGGCYCPKFVTAPVRPTDDAPPAIVPALSPEEWDRGYIGCDVDASLRTPGLSTIGPRVEVCVKAAPLGGSMGDVRDLHALAALCLHQQPFGFTHDDVQICTQAAAFFAAKHDGDCVDAEWFMGLAARIAALLPPEDQTP